MNNPVLDNAMKMTEAIAVAPGRRRDAQFWLLSDALASSGLKSVASTPGLNGKLRAGILGTLDQQSAVLSPVTPASLAAQIIKMPTRSNKGLGGKPQGPTPSPN